MNASEKAKEIFLNATEKASPADRQAYLNAACGDDAALRRDVVLSRCARRAYAMGGRWATYSAVGR